MLQHLDSAILAAIPDDAFPDQKTRKEAEALLQKEAAPARMIQLVAQAIHQDFNPTALEEVAAFYRSPLGKKVCQITGTSLLPGNLREIRESSNLVAGLKETRLHLLKRILEADRVAELNAALLTEAVEGLVDGAAFEGPSHGSIEDDEYKKMLSIDSVIRSEKARTEKVALMASTYTFRSLTDEELESLAGHLESMAAQWFRKALHEGLRHSVYQAANTLGRFLGKRRRDLNRANSGPEAGTPAPKQADKANDANE